MQNNMDASLEDEHLLLLPLRRHRKRRSLRKALRHASRRFWVWNNEEFIEEYYCLVQELRNEEKEYFAGKIKNN